MQTFPDHDVAVYQSGCDPTVTVSMCDDHLVIRAHADVDVEMTEVLVMAAASAVATGATVMIDLAPNVASGELIARRPLGVVAADCITGDGGPVNVLGAGYVRLATRHATWTIDVIQGRLCRSEDPIDPHFVGPADWTAIQALWVTAATVTALTTDGMYLSTLAEWTVDDRPGRPALA